MELFCKRSFCTFTRGDFIGYVCVKIVRGVAEFEDLELEVDKFLEEKFFPFLNIASPLPEDSDSDNIIIHTVSDDGFSVVQLYCTVMPEPSNFRFISEVTRSFAYRICRQSDKMLEAIAESLHS